MECFSVEKRCSEGLKRAWKGKTHFPKGGKKKRTIIPEKTCQPVACMLQTSSLLRFPPNILFLNPVYP
jgi:hypothetical protein